MSESPQPTPATRSALVQGSTMSAAVLLAAALFVMVNYLSFRHYERFDATGSELYTLSEKSANVVVGLDRPIDIAVLLSPESEVYVAVDELLDRYAAANPEKFRRRDLDPVKEPLEFKSLVERYRIERPNVIVVATDDDQRILNEFDLVEYDYSGAQMGQPPTLQEFKGEQQITSAILSLLEAKKPKIVFTRGHGEAGSAGSPRSFDQAQQLLGRDNFAIEEWTSLSEAEVPRDADLLVIAGPETNFLPHELHAISMYLRGGGRALLMLDPAFAESSVEIQSLGFADWLAEFGVELRADVVVDPVNVVPFFSAETFYTTRFGNHPIVDGLVGAPVLLSLARSVKAADNPPAEHEVTELILTSDEAWGETDLEADPVQPDDDVDLTGPVPLAVAVSFPASVPALGVTGDSAEAAGGKLDSPLADLDSSDEKSQSADEGRLVVIGDFEFADDSHIANGLNSSLLLNAFNWLVEREQLIEIEGRRPEQTRLTMGNAELRMMYLMVLLIMPAIAIIAGVWIAMSRRR